MHPNPRKLLSQLLDRLPVEEKQEISRSMLHMAWVIIGHDRSRLLPDSHDTSNALPSSTNSEKNTTWEDEGVHLPEELQELAIGKSLSSVVPECFLNGHSSKEPFLQEICINPNKKTLSISSSDNLSSAVAQCSFAASMQIQSIMKTSLPLTNHCELSSFQQQFCVFCSTHAHSTVTCPEPPPNKINRIRELNLCKRCLDPSHRKPNCPRDDIRCAECEQDHLDYVWHKPTGWLKSFPTQPATTSVNNTGKSTMKASFLINFDDWTVNVNHVSQASAVTLYYDYNSFLVRILVKVNNLSI